MNQISKLPLNQTDGLRSPLDDLSREEIRKLKALLSLVNISSEGERLEIGNPDAKLVITKNGKLRLKGRSITQVARGEFRVDAAMIELN